MRIVICDDEKCYVDAVVASINRWQAFHKVVSVSITTYHSSEDLLEFTARSVPYDLAFLDIQFPSELSGLALAQRLRVINEQMAIVFMTNYDEYAIEGYRVNALRFLQKPISDPHIFECCDIAYRQWSLLNGTSLIVESNQNLHRLPYASILYVESHGHYISIYLAQGGHTIKSRSKLSELYSNLPNEMFVQCHRSYIINLLYVRSISKNNVILSNAEKIPVGAKFWEKLHTHFRSFFQGGSHAL